jgi:hypothetical protein
LLNRRRLPRLIGLLQVLAVHPGHAGREGRDNCHAQSELGQGGIGMGLAEVPRLQSRRRGCSGSRDGEQDELDPFPLDQAWEVVYYAEPRNPGQLCRYRVASSGLPDRGQRLGAGTPLERDAAEAMITRPSRSTTSRAHTVQDWPRLIDPSAKQSISGQLIW